MRCLREREVKWTAWAARTGLSLGSFNCILGLVLYPRSRVVSQIEGVSWLPGKLQWNFLQLGIPLQGETILAWFFALCPILPGSWGIHSQVFPSSLASQTSLFLLTSFSPSWVTRARFQRAYTSGGETWFANTADYNECHLKRSKTKSAMKLWKRNVKSCSEC